MTIDSRFHLRKDDIAIVITDFQEKFTNVIRSDVYDKVSLNINNLVYLARFLDIPLIVTEQYPKGLGPTCKLLQETLQESYSPIEKVTFSCYRNETFRNELQHIGANQLILIGLETHVCILQTALDLVAVGYKVNILKDAVCSRYKTDWETGLKLAEQAGIIISTTEITIFQLLREAGTIEFQFMTPLIKKRQL